jgi:hypothetical protein
MDIASHFYNLNNFSGLKQIYASLETSSVARLRLTREKAGLEQHEMYAKLKWLFDDHDKGYLERLRNSYPPCMPFIGSHLTNIYRKHEYNKLYYDQEPSYTSKSQSNTPNTSLIYFAKYRLIVEFINEVLQYQNASYKLRVHHKIRSFLVYDLDVYFERAHEKFKQESVLSAETLLSQAHSNNPAKMIEQMVESHIYDLSKQVEPSNSTESSLKVFPRRKTYPLKAPTSSGSWTQSAIKER